MSNFEPVDEPRLAPGFTIERVLVNRDPVVYRYDLVNPHGRCIFQASEEQTDEASIRNELIKMSHNPKVRDQQVTVIPTKGPVDVKRYKGRLIESRHATHNIPPKDAVNVDKLLDGVLTTDPEAQARLAKFNAPHDYIYWVSDDFADLLRIAIDQYDAMPNTTNDVRIMPLNPEVFKIDRGVIVFETPQVLNHLVQDDTIDLINRDIPVRAISWQKMPNGNVKIGSHVELTNIDGQNPREMFPIDLMDIDMDAAKTNSSIPVLPFDLVSYIFTFLTMLNQQGLTSSTTLESPSIPAPKTPGSKKKAKRIKVPDVRVVTLRPGSISASTHRNLHADDAATREYAHRWLVRGHWRNQPYPSLGEGVTKRIWIESYIKGPDGKPLLTTPKVTAVRGD